MTPDEIAEARAEDRATEHALSGPRDSVLCTRCGNYYTFYRHATHDQSFCYGCRHAEAARKRRIKGGTWTDIEEQLRAEAQAKAGKPYDPLARRLSQSQIAAQDNDTAVEEQNRLACAEADNRSSDSQIWSDDEVISAETIWDRIREGRSAT